MHSKKIESEGIYKQSNKEQNFKRKGSLFTLTHGENEDRFQLTSDVYVNSDIKS